MALPDWRAEVVVAFASVIAGRDLLAAGFLLTVGLSIAGTAGALLLAFPLALMKRSGRPWLSWPATGCVELLRNAPFPVVLVLIHFGAPRLIVRLAPWQSGLLALSLYGAAYFAEVLRGALAAVPKGQVEAARALGLRWPAVMRRVVLPQMMVAAVPPGRVVAVMLLKDSAVLSILAVPELTHAALRIQADSFSTVPVFAALAILYWLMTLAVAALAGRLEAGPRTRRRLAMHGSAVAARYLALDWPAR